MLSICQTTRLVWSLIWTLPFVGVSEKSKKQLTLVASSTSCGRTTEWYWDYWSATTRQCGSYRIQSRGAYRCWSCHGVTYVTRVIAQCFAVLRHAAYQSDAVTFDVEDGGGRVSPITTGLREQWVTGLHAYLVKRLQSVLNASARHIYGLGRFDHVSEALCRCFGCASHSVSNSNWRSWWSTEFYTATPQTISDRSLGCPTFQVDHHCVIHHLIIYSSLNCRCEGVSGVWASYLEQFAGLTLRLSTVCQSFTVVSRIICSCTRIQAPFNKVPMNT